jgi:putative oxidoreductase
VHLPNGIWAANGGWEYNAMLIAALVVLAEEGPGELSLDAALGLDDPGPAWGLAALALGAAASTAVIELGRRTPATLPGMPAAPAVSVDGSDGSSAFPDLAGDPTTKH